MASRRRPRTRVYDCNFNIGESHYRPVIDSLDRKYSGRPLDPVAPLGEREGTPSRLSQLLAEREREREREGSPGSRASKIFADMESNGFSMESQSHRPRAPLINDDDAAIDAEFEETMKRIRAARAAKNAEMEDEFDSYVSKKKINIADKVLDSVGLNSRTQRAIEDDVLYKQKRNLAYKFLEENDDKGGMTKWTAVRPGARALQEAEEVAEEASTGAMARARKSRARLADIDAELEDLAAKGAARQKRIQELRALVGEEENNSSQTSSSSMRVSKRVSVKSSSEQKHVSF